MEIVVLIGAIGLAAIGGYFAFRDEKFGRKPKQKTYGEYHHPYDLEKLPTGAYLHFQEGLTLCLKKQFEAAIAEYELALEICPAHKGLLFYITLTLVDMKRYDEAEAIVTELLEKNPLDYFAKYLRGVIHHNQGDFDTALKDYNSALYRQMGFPQPYLNRARLYLGKNDYEKAQADVDRAKQIAPESSQVWVLQGITHANQQKVEEAISSVEKAISYNINDVEALTVHAQILLQLGQLDKASEQTDYALALNPDFAQAQLVGADIYQNQQRWDDALKLYLKALKQISAVHNLYQIYTNLGLVYINLEDYENAISAAQKAIEQNPDEFWAYNNRGFAYFKLEKYDLAMADYNRAIELNPNEAKPYFNRAWLYSKMRNHQKAIEDCNAIIKLHPNQASAYNSRAWAKAVLGNYQDSLEDSQKAIELNSKNAFYFDTRAQAKWLLGDYEGALADYQHATELDLDNKSYQCLEGQAAALYKLKRTDEAIAAWKKLAEFDDEAQTADELQEKYRFAEPFYQALKEIESLAKD